MYKNRWTMQSVTNATLFSCLGYMGVKSQECDEEGLEPNILCIYKIYNSIQWLPTKQLPTSQSLQHHDKVFQLSEIVVIVMEFLGTSSLLSSLKETSNQQDLAQPCQSLPFSFPKLKHLSMFQKILSHVFMVEYSEINVFQIMTSKLSIFDCL